MNPNLRLWKLACIAALAMLFSCTKPSPIIGLQKHLQPFGVQVIFRQANLASISWEESTDQLGDSVWYKVTLNGKTIDSNLLRRTDSLRNLSFDVTYAGRVIAYTHDNDTVSAPFTLNALQGFTFFADANYAMTCADIFSDQVIWQSTANGAASSTYFIGTPVVNKDTVFECFGMHNTYAFNAKTGQTIWQSPVYLPTTSTSVNVTNLESVGDPIYSNGRIYVSSYAGLVCLSSSTGQPIWVHQDGDSYSTVPVADNGMVFVGSTGGSQNYFAALDVSTGAVIWKKPFGGYPTTYPMLCNGLLIFGDINSQIFAVDEKTGSRVWTRDLSISYNNQDSWMGPVHYNNIAVVWANEYLYALNTANGNTLWKLQDNDAGYNVSPYISHDTMFISQVVGTSTNQQLQLSAVRVTTGQVLWQTIASQTIETTPLVAEGRIYMPGYEGMQVFDSRNGNLLQTLYHGWPGTLELDGIVYYHSESGMVQ